MRVTTTGLQLYSIRATITNLPTGVWIPQTLIPYLRTHRPQLLRCIAHWGLPRPILELAIHNYWTSNLWQVSWHCWVHLLIYAYWNNALSTFGAKYVWTAEERLTVLIPHSRRCISPFLRPHTTATGQITDLSLWRKHPFTALSTF